MQTPGAIVRSAIRAKLRAARLNDGGDVTELRNQVAVTVKRWREDDSAAKSGYGRNLRQLCYLLWSPGEFTMKRLTTAYLLSG